MKAVIGTAMEPLEVEGVKIVGKETVLMVYLVPESTDDMKTLAALMAQSAVEKPYRITLLGRTRVEVRSSFLKQYLVAVLEMPKVSDIVNAFEADKK